MRRGWWNGQEEIWGLEAQAGFEGAGDRMCSKCCVLGQGSRELGVWEGVKDQPALILKFDPRSWGKTSSSGCSVHVPVTGICFLPEQSHLSGAPYFKVVALRQPAR